MPLDTCQLDLAEGPECEVIMKRVCQFGSNTETLNICQNHRDKIGKHFIRDRKLSCKCPTHNSGPKTLKDKPKKIVTSDLSQQLWSGLHIMIPFGSFLCNSCYKEQLEKLAERMEESDEDIFDSNSQPYSVAYSEDLFPASAPLEDSFCDDSYHVPSQDALPSRRDALNNYLTLSNNNVKCTYTLTKPFEELSVSRQYKLVDLMATTICSTLRTVNSLPGNDSAIWKKIIDSGIMHQRMRGERPMCKLLEESIKTWNASANKNVQKQLLTLLITKYSYPQLDAFNSKQYRSKNPVALEEGGVSEALITNAIKNLHWIPALTKYAYDHASKRYAESGFALNPIVSASHFVWRLEREVIALIMSFITSDEIIQGMAYGTFTMTDDSGEKKVMAKVVRTVQKGSLA